MEFKNWQKIRLKMATVYIPKIGTENTLVPIGILYMQMPHREIMKAALWWSPVFHPENRIKDMDEIDPPCEVVFMAEIIAEKDNFSEKEMDFLNKHVIAMYGNDYVIPTEYKETFLNLKK